MNGAENNEQPYISPDTNIRIPVGILAGIVAAVALWLFFEIQAAKDDFRQQIQVFHDSADQKMAAFGEKLNTKAADRYTGTMAAADKAAIQTSISALQWQQIATKEALQREIDHIHSDFDQHVEECRRNHDHQ